MLELQEITVDKKELFNKYLSRKCSQNSEFTFTNFFMWRKSYDMKYVIINDMLCIMPRHNGGPRSATFPIGFKNEDGTNPDIVPVINELLNYFEERNEEPLIRLYDDTAVQMLIESFPGRFLITEDVNYFDYVYNIDELIKLPGKRFHGKRNHVNKFKTTYNWEYNSLNAKNCNECLALFDK
ncbi:MAG: phosphatidylglycerol lysyltransferase domain-containing protein, partial [Oscillospiraceae bacterium]